LQDEDIHVVLQLIKKSLKPWVAPVVGRLAEEGAGPFKILMAGILSLRTRDQVVGEASERLFALVAHLALMATINLKKLEKTIFPVGFYRTKAKPIREMCKQNCRDFQGKVPNKIEELVKLPGVGRKTANLVVTLGYKASGIG